MCIVSLFLSYHLFMCPFIEQFNSKSVMDGALFAKGGMVIQIEIHFNVKIKLVIAMNAQENKRAHLCRNWDGIYPPQTLLIARGA